MNLDQSNPFHLSTKFISSKPTEQIYSSKKKKKQKMTFRIANSHRNISQQLSRPSIGLGKPSLANKLRYTGPIDGFPSVACFAGSTSIIYFLSSISISSSLFFYIIELKNSNIIYIYIYRLNLQQRQVEKRQSLEVEV